MESWTSILTALEKRLTGKQRRKRRETRHTQIKRVRREGGEACKAQPAGVQRRGPALRSAGPRSRVAAHGKKIVMVCVCEKKKGRKKHTIGG